MPNTICYFKIYDETVIFKSLYINASYLKINIGLLTVNWVETI